MHRHRPLLLLQRTAACLLAALSAGLAPAQVPPHRPGTVCFTPSFWCWAAAPGRPNTACSCPSPYGAVRGTLN